MNIMQSRHEIKIVSLVEQVLGLKLNLQENPNDLILVNLPNNINYMDRIKEYIQNPNLVNDQLIAKLIKNQNAKYTFKQASFNLDLDNINTWDKYIAVLNDVLSKVKYRKQKDYIFNEIMPTQQELFALQQLCFTLTMQEYGVGNFNVYYLYFIEMNQAAGISCFVYRDIEKEISVDHYITRVYPPSRRAAMLAQDQKNQLFAKQGGMLPGGNSIIDATCVNNIFYYKTAQLMYYYAYAQGLVCQALKLENYGQLEQKKSQSLWGLLRETYPDDSAQDAENIFYKFAVYSQDRPGEYFNYFDKCLPEANHISAQLLHDIIKIVGIETNHLILFDHGVSDNFAPKRYMPIHWQRKYPLLDLRKVNDIERARLLSNNIPYGPAHGLSMCGNGLPDRQLQFTVNEDTELVYAWNSPIDATAEINNLPKDIEKLFRELQLLSPPINRKHLTNEQPLNLFQNTIEYSSIQATQHIHILKGYFEDYYIYNLPATNTFNVYPMNLAIELVQVGKSIDAFYIRIFFDSLEDEDLIKFLIDLNHEFFAYFGGIDKADVYMHLFLTQNNNYAFIYVPHARLKLVEHDLFFNQENNTFSLRKPQYLQPEGTNLRLFTNEFARGLDFLRQFFDETCKKDTYKFLVQFIDRYFPAHQ